MMKRYVASALTLFFAGATVVGAQQNPPSSPQSPAQQPPPTVQPAPAPTPAPAPGQQTSASPRTSSSITLSGCLVREQDVPGRKPNVAERAGVLEDYILTSASIASSGTSSSTQSQTPVGTSGTQSQNISSMYKVEGIADNQLKTLVGKRVEVTGKIDEDDARESSSAGSATPRKADDDMPEFEATAIREVPGTCQAAIR